MAMIKCKECGKEISSTAEKCPHCGYKTAHGQNVSGAKMLLVFWAITIVCMVVGVILLLVNMGEFMDLKDYLDEFKYFSDEEQKAVQTFGVGVLMSIGGFGMMIALSLDARRLQNSGGNSYLSENNGYSATATQYNVEWECSRCYTTNAPGASRCVKCGAAKNSGPSSGIQERIPTWKRIQMEEAQQKAEQEKTQKEANTQANKCAFCGEPMSEGQQFCGACGKKKE